MNKKSTVVVTQPEEPIAAEIIATAIVKISDATKAMLSAGLKQSTIVALVHDQSKVSKRDIITVINNLHTLRQDWTTR